MIDIVPPAVNRDKLRRPTKHTVSSLYRDAPHTTVNGRGIVGQLSQKRRNPRKARR